MKCRQQPGSSFDQDHSRPARIGDPKIARNDIDGQLLDRPGQLDAGGTPADDDEGQMGRLALRVRFEFSNLE